MKRLGIILLCLVLTAFSAGSYAQNMTVAPDVINLNAVGNFESLQCVYSQGLPSANITSHDIQVTLDGNYIMDATSVHYCITDCNVFVEIAREAFQNNPFVRALANLGPRVLAINGNFTVTAGGVEYNYTVNRWGTLEVIQPGKKK